MIEIPVSMLLAPGLRSTLSKLSACPDLGTKVTYRLMRTVSQVDSKARDALRRLEVLRSMYVQTDDGGTYLLNEDQTEYLWKDGVDPDMAKSDIEAFGGSSVDIPQALFDLDDFAPAKLTAMDMAAIEPLYTPLE